MSATPPRECISTTPPARRRIRHAISGSSRSPETSFTMCAPAASAASATARLHRVHRDRRARGRSAASVANHREHAPQLVVRRAPGRAPCGRVDSPPTSMMSAPSAISVAACASAASERQESPAVAEAVRRDVDDAHHQRTVEAQRSTADRPGGWRWHPENITPDARAKPCAANDRNGREPFAARRDEGRRRTSASPPL